MRWTFAATLGLICVVAAVTALAAPPATTADGAMSSDTTLPPAVASALERARLPAEALSVYLVELGPRSGSVAPKLVHRAQQPVNPASLMKLYTTGAALELLGPAWTWSTPVLAAGRIDNNVLHGDLVLQGRGDPSLTLERLWLLLRQVQQRGIVEIRGDIVLDGGVLAGLAPGGAGDFDGEPSKPYNVRPDALLLNLKAITLSFVPEPASGSARVIADAPLAGVAVDARVPLAAGPCGDWRSALKAELGDPTRLRFAGSYPAACGERAWPIAYADPASYNARLLEALWRELGGRIVGRARNGTTPAGATPLFEQSSPALAAVVRDINKFSNNVMAEQLFLSLALVQAGAGRAAAAIPATVAASVPEAASAAASEPAASAPDATAPPVVPPPVVVPSEPRSMPPLLLAPRLPDSQQRARELLAAQVRLRAGCVESELLIDNGSGLSRQARTSARCLGQWLQALWASPVMPELMSSLPVSGVDGTARRPGRQWGAALGRAHLKTGSLREVSGIAGYVLALSGRRYALVAIVNHPQAAAARPVLDALVQWAVEDGER